MSEAQKQLAEIEAIVNPTVACPEPRKRSRPVPVVGVGARVEDDDDEPAVNEGEPLPVVSAAPVVVPSVAVAGLPDIAAHPAVVAARANVDRVAAQQKATADQIAELERGLGLKAGASARDLDNLAARILATGGTDDTAEKFGKLESLKVHAKRLDMAAAIVAKEYTAAREKAARELTAAAHAANLAPATAAVAVAYFEFVKAAVREQAACDALRLGGFGFPSSSLPPEMFDQWQNPFLIGFVNAGHLERSEVRDAFPHLHGL